MGGGVKQATRRIVKQNGILINNSVAMVVNTISGPGI